MSLTEFFEYLIVHDETRDLGSDLVHTYYERVDAVAGAGGTATDAGTGVTTAA